MLKGYYLQKVKGAYIRLGCFNGEVDEIHKPNFDVDEECIFTGIKTLFSIINQY